MPLEVLLPESDIFTSCRKYFLEESIFSLPGRSTSNPSDIFKASLAENVSRILTSIAVEDWPQEREDSVKVCSKPRILRSIFESLRSHKLRRNLKVQGCINCEEVRHSKSEVKASFLF